MRLTPAIGFLIVMSWAWPASTQPTTTVHCVAAGGIATTEPDNPDDARDDEDQLEITVWTPPSSARDTVTAADALVTVVLVDLSDPNEGFLSETHKLPANGVVRESVSRKNLTDAFGANSTEFGVLIELEAQEAIALPPGRLENAGPPPEEVVLNFAKVKLEYMSAADEDRPSHEAGWDVETTECKSEDSNSAVE